MPITAVVNPVIQNGWRWCHKCQGEFFSGNPSQGVCPADGQAHDASQSGHYSGILNDDGAVGTQSGWRWCRKCQGMFFSGNTSQGVCPADHQTHDDSQSGHYAFVLGESEPGYQGDWRWCRKCQGMFFSGNPSQGICPADGKAHDASQSGHYALSLEIPTTINLTWPPDQFSGGDTKASFSTQLTLNSDGTGTFSGSYTNEGTVPIVTAPAQDYSVAVVISSSNNSIAFSFEHSDKGVPSAPQAGSGSSWSIPINNAAIKDNWIFIALGGHSAGKCNNVVTLGDLVPALTSAVNDIVAVAGPIAQIVAAVVA